MNYGFTFCCGKLNIEGLILRKTQCFISNSMINRSWLIEVGKMASAGQAQEIWIFVSRVIDSSKFSHSKIITRANQELNA
jgi:hypothetical protein